METESVKVDVKAMVLSQSPPLLGFSSNVVISLNWENEEFLVDESDGSVTSLGSSPASSPPPLPNPQIFPKFRNFTPGYVYKRLNSRFHDPVLSRKISDEIVVEAQRSSQDLPLVMGVLVTLTQKVYVVMPCRPAPSSTRDLATEICAVCLESLSESGSETKPYCELPNCHHRFHEECFVKWYFDRSNNSCPLCRQSVYEQPETE